MKKLLLMATMFFMFGAAKAQIAEVKQDGQIARIYNDQGKYTGKNISLSSNMEVSGYNSKYIVISDGKIARIYDDQGKYTGKNISLSSTMSVKNVAATAILITDGVLTRYYDFDGKYTGKNTKN